ncbi:glycosyltransferase family 4 protein [Flavobacteriaceae bacterium GF1]
MKRRICIIRASDITFISRIHRTAQALQESGKYEVSVLSIMPRRYDPTKYSYKTIYIPIKSRVLKSSFFSIVRIVEGLVKLFFRANKQKAHIYIPVGIEDLIIVYIISRLKKTKFVYSANELEGDRKRVGNKRVNDFLNQQVIKIEKWILKKSDGVIAADLERAKVMEKWYGLDKVEVVRNVPIYEDLKNENLIRKKLNISQESKILLYQGMLSPGRGLEVSIEACAQSSCQSRVHLVLLGFITEDYKNKLQRIANNHGFKNLNILPPVPWKELLLWTKSADISLVLIENVSISYYLAAPNKLYETIMAGVPYIASNFPEIQHVHKVAKSGLLVNPENVNEISKAIDSLIEDKALYESCNSFSEYAKTVFNWSLEQKKLLQIIDTVSLQ